MIQADKCGLLTAVAPLAGTAVVLNVHDGGNDAVLRGELPGKSFQSSKRLTLFIITILPVLISLNNVLDQKMFKRHVRHIESRVSKSSIHDLTDYPFFAVSHFHQLQNVYCYHTVKYKAENRNKIPLFSFLYGIMLMIPV